MGIRIVQVCGIWFWAAFTFFFFVLLHQYRIISLPAIQTPSESINHEAIRAGLNTSERFARSEASWRASVDLRHKIAAQGMDPQNPLFSSNFMQHPYTIWDFYPPSWTCPHDVQRVGRLGDGGKWVCGMSLYETVPAPKLAGDKETIIYSFGINGESTFEEDMLARIPSSRIWAYDFSVESFGPQLSPSHASRAHFRKLGLGNTDEAGKTPPFYTLQTLMAQNQHTYIDILKIDIEGAEYKSLEAFMDSCVEEKMMPVGQIMIELHLNRETGFEWFMGWWERLESLGMRPTWLEVNLLAITLVQEHSDPGCVEFVLVNSKDERSVLLAE